MFGGLGDLAGMLKQAKQMQSRMKEMQAALEASTYQADAGGGAVTATVNGKMSLVSIKLSPDSVKTGDVEMLEDLITAAVAAAQRKAAEGAREKMKEVTGGINIPGLDGLLESP
jgi:nucleoid-associated protein EbfC